MTREARPFPTALCFLTLGAVTMAPLVAQGVRGPFQNPANGHSYYVSNSTVTFNTARSLAATTGGYLVAINDRDEESWISSMLVGQQHTWIGLQRAPGTAFTTWLSGERLVYTNWCVGEPNNPNTEHVGMMNWCGTNGWNNVTANSNDRFLAVIEIPRPYQFTSFGSGCPGNNGRFPRLSTPFGQILRPGSPVTINIADLPASVMPHDIFIVVGLPPRPMPIDLSFLGMTGCPLLVPTTAWFGGVVTSPFGMASWTSPFGLPTQGLLLQAVVHDRGANPAGLIVSNGGEI